MRYSVKAAALATGVSESRLRTWERRYGVPSPARSPTGRRLYGEEDLAIIRRMAGLVAAGIPSSEAADSARTEGAAGPATTTPPLQPPSEHPLVAAITEASISYDEPATMQALTGAVTAMGWPDALDDVLMPALRALGRSWSQNEVVSSNEHFTSEIIRREISSASTKLRAIEAGPCVLLACGEDERHEIGLLALSFLLRTRGLRTVYLGGDVPTSDLLAAIQQTHPDAVCLSATTSTARGSLARATRALTGVKANFRVYVGGPAFQDQAGDPTIAGVLLPQTLRAATDVIEQGLRSGRYPRG